MNPAIFFPVAGVVLVVWGTVVAVFARWAARLMTATQRVWGRWAADRVQPGLTRVIGIGLALMGVVFIVLGLTGAIPSR